ncbi:hypothetical protein CS390_10870 [Pseudomonas sp. HLS-6]|uniref:hypothetical protein n=1 Tax=Pseudomonas sp. HLS-6 TaxID=2049589 RepID=UPI000C180970|nr:hypothetical protein [Pseudomonas sp. HLS-6]ATR83016.1 hypothetical protein CS390_10870 [Pseudomonas sp. HLS-6]
MQIFSTDFPLANGTTPIQILEECLYWISESPHTNFTQSQLLENIKVAEFKKTAPRETIEFEYADDEKMQIHSFVYTKKDQSHAWVTTVSFLTLPQTGEAWVNVKAYCNSFIATTKTPEIKKPLIIIRLIDRYGGGIDGDLKVNHEHVELKDTLIDLQYAADLINGETGNRLPIVLITKYHSGFCAAIPDRLARSLSGLAHVVVEPNRAFSNKLRTYVNSQNVYGGAIGIYWPSDGGVSIHRKSSDKSTKAFEVEIFTELRSMISQRMPLRECSIEALRETKNRKLIQKLKSEESLDVSAYIEAFDAEIKAKEEQIETLKREVHRLEGVSKALRSKNPVQGGLQINIGDEEDFFDDEILWIILDALRDQCERVPEDSRRLHILQSIANQPAPKKISTEISHTIRETLRGYREMSSRTRTTLEKLGFEISDEGKHLKLTYQEDSRYTFTLPKSGSDGRGGLNAASDMIKLFF